MKLVIPITRSRYDCGECGCVGSAPTHKPKCSRSAFSLGKLRLIDLQARYIDLGTNPQDRRWRGKRIPDLSREQLISALLVAR